MKKAKIIAIILVSVLVIAAAVTGSISVYNTKLIEEYKESASNLPDGFVYTAHTGCINTRDNSLEAIDAGYEFGAGIVEFDLNFDENNTPVLAHDDPKGGEVTLDEAFARVALYDGLQVNVDAKSTAALEKVVELAVKHGILDRIFFTGIEEKDVETVRKDAPEVSYYLNCEVYPAKKQTEEYLLSLVEKVKSSGAVGINFNKKNATKELVDCFHENGLLVSVWTVNNKTELYKILSLSPDNITTRRPDLLKKILDE